MAADQAQGQRALLAAEHAAAAAQVTALERELDGIISAAGGANADDEHDPEGATIAFERQHVAALLAQARDQLTAAGRAAAKLDDGSYGICESCGGPIGEERLAPRPPAVTGISGAGGGSRR
ncbi:MAG: TraR/DksA family transcriptional regulator [Streptosporangiaceae bacterium]